MAARKRANSKGTDSSTTSSDDVYAECSAGTAMMMGGRDDIDGLLTTPGADAASIASSATRSVDAYYEDEERGGDELEDFKPSPLNDR